MAPKRPAVAAAAVYALLSLLMVGHGLLPGWTLSPSDSLWSATPWAADRPADVPPLGSNFELADDSEVFIPFARWSREPLWADVPLWNPHIMGGRPFVGNAQSALFSPFSVPGQVLPFWDSLAIAALLKLFVAAFGAYALARLLGMRFGGALAAGVIYAFGTFFIVWLAWPLTNIFALVPWLLVLAELLVRRPGPLPAAGLAALVALQFFGGHPESSFHAGVVLVVFFAFRLVTRLRAEGRPARDAVRPAVAFLLASLTGAAIAAVALVPFLELLYGSGDLERRLDTEAGHWPAKYLGALFLHDYWGRPTNGSTIEPFTVIRGWYAGAATLMLAAAALVLRPTRERVAVAVFAVLCGLIVVGADPFFWVVTQLPGFSAAHNQRLLIYVLLALALLAGWGLDDLAGERLPELSRRRLVVGGAVAILLVPVVWMALAGTLALGELGRGLEVAWGFADPPAVDRANPGNAAADAVRMSALLQWLPLAGLALALIAWRLWPARRIPAAAFAAAVVALLAVDLFRANLGFNPAIRERNAVQPVTPAMEYLQSRRPARFVGLGAGVAYQPLASDLAMTYDLYDARGYDFPVEKRFDRLWRRSVAPDVVTITQPVEYATATPAALRALSLLSVGDLLQEPGAPAPRAPGLRRAYRGADADVYANENALPRAFLVGSQRVVASEDEALAAVTAPGFDGRGVAITESAVEGLPRGAGGASAGEAELVSYEHERVLVDATARRPALLVLTDVHFPGWQVRVDGSEADLERVDYLLRGVMLEPGRHRVEFAYRPASWTVARVLTLAGLVALAAALAAGLVPRLRRRRR
jgi:hypothetical protein